MFTHTRKEPTINNVYTEKGTGKNDITKAERLRYNIATGLLSLGCKNELDIIVVCACMHGKALFIANILVPPVLVCF